MVRLIVQIVKLRIRLELWLLKLYWRIAIMALKVACVLAFGSFCCYLGSEYGEPVGQAVFFGLLFLPIRFEKLA